MTTIRAGIACPNCNTLGAWAPFSDPGYGEYAYQEGPIRCNRCGWNQAQRPLLRKDRVEQIPEDKTNGIDYPSTAETIFAVGAYSLLGLLVLGAFVSACIGVWKILGWLAGMIF